MTKKYLGIDIGTDNIKIANVTAGKKAVALEDPVMIKTPRFLIRNGELEQKAELVNLLAEAVSKRKPGTKKAVVILSDSAAVTREMEIPPVPLPELENIIKLDASEYLPFNVEEYTIRYRILQPHTRSAGKTDFVLMASARNHLVMELYEIIKSVGFRPVAMDVAMNSMIKYYQHTVNLKNAARTADDSVSAMMDLGAAAVRVVIFLGTTPLLLQTLNHSSQRIDVVLANTFGLEREEAEMRKIQYGLSFLYGNNEEEAGSMGAVINRQIDLMLNDVYKCFQSFVSKYGTQQVAKILLTGGMSQMTGLARYIQDAFSVPCTVAEPCEAAEFSVENGVRLENSQKNSSIFPFYTNIAGAACRGD